jgi:hypothetical protein
MTFGRFCVASLLIISWQSPADAEAIVVTGSEYFRLPSETFVAIGDGVDGFGSIYDDPIHGDFLLEATLVASSPGANIREIFWFDLTYDPTRQGAIESIDWSVELDATPEFEPLVSLALRQGGEVYHLPQHRDQTDDGIFTDFSQFGLLATDFSRRTSANHLVSGNPDFTRDGGALDFGIMLAFATDGAQQTRQQEFRNVVLTINSTPVPEPSSFAALAGMLLLGLVLMGSRRQKGLSR